MTSGNRARVFGAAAVVAVMVLAATGCKGSDTVTGLERAATPTPVSLADASGTWHGTWSTNDAADCSPPLATATATLSQSGSEIVGTLVITSDCGIRADIQGTISGTTFAGQIVYVAGFSGGGFTGTASSAGIHVSVRDLTRPDGNGGTQVIPGGRLDLGR